MSVFDGLSKIQLVTIFRHSNALVRSSQSSLTVPFVLKHDEKLGCFSEFQIKPMHFYSDTENI